MNKSLSKQEIKSKLKKDYQNFDIKIFDTVTSTNDFAKEIINSNNFEHGTTIIANTQTKGRGRFGKTFFSPSDTGIYLSTIFNIHLKIQDISLITIISAIAVCNTISEITGLSPQIKWINDVYLNNKKVCGILVENINDTTNLISKAVVIGIGINISTNVFPQDIQNIATSVMADVSRNIFIAELINNLYDLLKDIHSKNIIEQYKQLSLVLGKKITYTVEETGMRYQPDKTAIIIDHVGNVHRHGLPDQDREWTLEPKPPKKKQNTVAVRQCPECYYTHEPAGVCPNCGHIYEVQRKESPKEQRDAHLQKISEIKLKDAALFTWEQVREFQQAHHYNFNWCFHYCLKHDIEIPSKYRGMMWRLGLI